MVKCAHDILEQIYNENLTCFGKSTFNFLHDDSHIIILFSFGKKGLVLTFIKIKANLFLHLAYQKGIPKFAKPIIHNMTQINSSFVKSFHY